MEHWFTPAWDGGGEPCGYCDGVGEVPDWRDNRLARPCPLCEGCGHLVHVGPPSIPIRRCS